MLGTRSRLVGITLGLGLAAGHLVSACEAAPVEPPCDGDAGPCETRDAQVAAPPLPEAGSACAAEASACNVDQDCCTGRCETLRCTTATPPAPAPCVAVLGACSNPTQCCQGLTCKSGTCR